MATRTGSRAVPDSYFELVKRFPLVPVRDDGHLDDAVAVLEELLAADTDEGGRAYLEVLTGLIEQYENGHVDVPDASEADVLRELMRARGLTQGKLAKEVGITQSTISAVLGGTRELTKGQIIKLADYFHVLPTAFLPAAAKRAQARTRTSGG